MFLEKDIHGVLVKQPLKDKERRVGTNDMDTELAQEMTSAEAH